MINEQISGYTSDDIVKVIQRAYNETYENREKIKVLYDNMESLMLAGKGDLIVLSQMADKYLEQITSQTELLIRLASVMQKLNQYGAKSNELGGSDINMLLKKLDEEKITPFTTHKPGKPKADPKPVPVSEEKVKVENVEL